MNEVIVFKLHERQSADVNSDKYSHKNVDSGSCSWSNLWLILALRFFAFYIVSIIVHHSTERVEKTRTTGLNPQQTNRKGNGGGKDRLLKMRWLYTVWYECVSNLVQERCVGPRKGLRHRKTPCLQRSRVNSYYPCWNIYEPDRVLLRICLKVKLCNIIFTASCTCYILFRNNIVWLQQNFT